MLKQVDSMLKREIDFLKHSEARFGKVNGGGASDKPAGARIRRADSVSYRRTSDVSIRNPRTFSG
jgi:hypothetical protein